MKLPKKARNINGLSEDELQSLSRFARRYLESSPAPKWLKILGKIVCSLLVVASYVYMLAPTDLILDAIPVAGVADDAGFVGLGTGIVAVWAKLQQLERFRPLLMTLKDKALKNEADYQAAQSLAIVEPSSISIQDTPKSFTVRVPRALAVPEEPPHPID